MTKGNETRERILDRAFRLASRDGLDGLSLGALASDLGLSKSGLFAHFRSKEDLEVSVLEAASTRFEDRVVRPALKAPRGLPRLTKLFEGWLRWLADPASPGGCIFIAASAELDDREGRPRDYLVDKQAQLVSMLGNLARSAVEERHFRPDVDPKQFAFEMYAIIFIAHHFRRLLRDGEADRRARTAFQRLVASAESKH
jgi:AcrR family transcriptional regulator